MRTRDRAALLGLTLICAAPLVPRVVLVGPLSTDDILPLAGVLALIRGAGPARRLPRGAVVAAAGVFLLIVAGLMSTVANSSSPTEAVALFGRGAGRAAFLAAIAVAASRALSPQLRRDVVARAFAAVGAIEALFGLVAYLVPLPDGMGLEMARQQSILNGLTRGRIAGTTGLSPDFLGAFFILSVLLTAGLALQEGTRGGRSRFWWALVGLQLVALALTFTRSSFVLTIAGLLVLTIAKRGLRVAGVLAGLTIVLLAVTPLGARLVLESNDRLALWSAAARMTLDHPLFGVGPGQMFAVAQADPSRYMHTPFGIAVANSHNTILLAAAETGIPGAIGALFVNVGLVARALAAVARSVRDRATPLVLAAAIAALAFLAQGMVNNLFTVGVDSVAFAMVLGSFLLDDATWPGDATGVGASASRPWLSNSRKRPSTRSDCIDDPPAEVWLMA